jgi:hypothetical protein
MVCSSLLRHFYVGFASPDPQFREAIDKRLGLLGVTYRNAALIEIFNGDTRLLE